MTNNLNTHAAKSPLGDLGVEAPFRGFGGGRRGKYSDIGFVNMFYNAPQILFEFAKSNRANPTEAEDFLWKQLCDNKLKQFHFRRQHPIKYFIADFYCHKTKLIIEVDGGYHTIPEQYEYDRTRDSELEELGITILHFTNEQVFYETDRVLETINNELHKYPQPPQGGFYP
ncbi:hypothetical protein AGMMS50239_01320 [Bacteroidia bacterium]|nr:hypothetical protein AGMMS50239_01320 [Bacteroidia bacterium]